MSVKNYLLIGGGVLAAGTPDSIQLWEDSSSRIFSRRRAWRLWLRNKSPAFSKSLEKKNTRSTDKSQPSQSTSPSRPGTILTLKWSSSSSKVPNRLWNSVNRSTESLNCAAHLSEQLVRPIVCSERVQPLSGAAEGRQGHLVFHWGSRKGLQN